jgi:SAM-dependent methyltransferase
LGVAQEEGWQIEGIELDPTTAEKARRDLDAPIHTGPTLQVLPTLGSFDLIIMSHWLEHSTHPGEALRLAAEHLSPGGGLLLRVPNANSLLARFTGASWSWFSPPNHLFYFDEGSLRNLTAAKGFTEEWAMTLRGDALLFPIELGIAFYRRLTGKPVTEIRGGRAAMAPTYLSRALERALPATRPWIWKNDTELAILLRRPIPPASPPAGRVAP